MRSTPQAKELRRLLREQGSSGRTATGQHGWNAFKLYAREMFGDGVGLLYQVGTFDFTGAPRFYFDSVVQFEVLDYDGDHDHFEQLHMELTCTPDDQSDGVSDELWSFEFPSADDFFRAVESRPSFQFAVGQTGYKASVSHEDV